MIPFKHMRYKQQMFLIRQNYYKLTSRASFHIVPTPFDVKNMPNLTPPSELFANSQFKFKNHKQNIKFGKFGLPHKNLALYQGNNPKKAARSQHWGVLRSPPLCLLGGFVPWSPHHKLCGARALQDMMYTTIIVHACTTVSLMMNCLGVAIHCRSFL